MDRPVPVIVHMVRWRAASVHRPEAESVGLYACRFRVLVGLQHDDPSKRIWRDEVFGPVVAVMPFDDEAEAIRLANGTEYGLASGVWTSSLSRAHRMVRAIKAGVVHVNTYGGPDITVPLGGVRQSGNGHDKSMHALDKYLDLKTAWIQL